MPEESPWLDFLEENPQAAYFGFQPQWGRSRGQQRYFQNQFQEIQNEYLGQLGQQILGGGAPSLKFLDFLQQFPFTQRYAQLSPVTRGESIGRFAPPVRFFPF